MAHDVFVSHSSKDKPTADAVCAMLESQGIRCWVAPRDITPGMDWGEAIVQAVKGARVMVLVFSASANESPQIKREVERAVNKGIPVIPLRIQDVAPTASLEYFISTPHWLDAFTPPLEGHLRYLAQIIQQILGTKPTTDGVSAPVVPLSGARATAGSRAQPAKPKDRRAAPLIGLLAGAVAFLAVALAGWWFGVEQPRREESRRLIEAERMKRAQAESESARMAEEQRKMKEAMDAAKRAEEKRQAAAALAKFEEEQRLAEEAAKIAEGNRRKEELAKLEEAKRREEAAKNAMEEQRKAEAVAASKSLVASTLVDKRETIQPPPTVTTPNDVVARASSPTAFNLIKEANLSVGEGSRDKVVSVTSEKSVGELTPSTWALLFYDPTTTWKAVQVSFSAGQKTGVSYPPRILEMFGSSDKFFDKSKLKIDSDKALEIAIKEPLLRNLTLKSSRMWLELRSGVPTWRIRLWAAKYRNPNDEADLGEVHVSADEGKVIRRDLHPERTN